jgi:hypothetical protein
LLQAVAIVSKPIDKKIVFITLVYLKSSDEQK